tara:strand:- start:1586 stop:2584 length:999 start_codon:yes stop_codon:yes gene_type:complete
MMKEILITGGSGYLGTVLVNKLVKKNYKIINLDPMIYSSSSTYQKTHRNVKNCIGVTEDKYILDDIFANNRIYAVIHLSGVSNDPTALLDPALTEKSNILATKLLVQKAKKNKTKKFLFASSCSVYGFTGEKKIVNEKSKPNPLSAYSKSKIIGEKIVIKEKSKNFTVNCLRMGTLYGPSPRMRFDLALNVMVGSAIQAKEIIINGGDQWRPFLHIDDAADAFIKLLENKNKKLNGQVYNVGANSENFQIKDLAYTVKKFVPKSKIKFSKNFDNRSYKANFDKIKNDLKWGPAKKIQDGALSVIKLFKTGKIKNFRDTNYYNIKRLISYLNI